MANQFTVETRVTFINELHLTGRAVIEMQKRGKIPTEFDIVQREEFINSSIIIFRPSKEFCKAFSNVLNKSIVLKSRY